MHVMNQLRHYRIELSYRGVERPLLADFRRQARLNRRLLLSKSHNFGEIYNGGYGH